MPTDDTRPLDESCIGDPSHQYHSHDDDPDDTRPDPLRNPPEPIANETESSYARRVELVTEARLREALCVIDDIIAREARNPLGNVGAQIRAAVAALAASGAVTEPCRVEPAFSQHEYAVDYCETHDQPADQCAAEPGAGEGLDVRLAAEALHEMEGPGRHSRPRLTRQICPGPGHHEAEAEKFIAALARLRAARTPTPEGER